MNDSFLLQAGLALVLLGSLMAGNGSAQEVKTMDAPAESAVDAVRQFDLPDPLKGEVYASEPLLTNPVAFTVDGKGRIYVAVTHRYGRGVNDNRNNWYWLIDDLAARTPKDRLEKFRKWANKGKRPMSYYRKYSEKIRRVTDPDGDGTAERSNVFAGGFDEAIAGPAAGVLYFRNQLYLTCIPYLWRLRDRDDDGTADERTKLHSGFGVRTSLRGHDLHALALGPDGRIYFSIGDRGYNVPTEDGRLVDDMDVGRGAVFRCEPDGSGLEVFHRGLRNPQDMAFDRYGNLFTVDNDSGGKDRSRLVYVVDGGDSGWMMSHQVMHRWDAYNERGAWQEEGLWKKHFPEQPDWIVPPVDHITEGPAGMAYYPGTGFTGDYADQFFVCDFRYNVKSTGIRTFSVSVDGAGFKMDFNKQFLWHVLGTDVEFGYDGRMYLTGLAKWGDKVMDGRIYSVHDPDGVRTDAVREVKRIFKQGFSDRPVEELGSLLSHPDRRVRLRSHIALANRSGPDAVKQLRRVALDGKKDLLPRLHGIWGLGIVGRRKNSEVLKALVQLLDAEASKIRSQVAKVIGEAGYAEAAPDVAKRLTDDSLRVRYFALQALADLGWTNALRPCVRLVRAHAKGHPYLRHAAVMYLKAFPAERLLDYADDPSSEVRTAVLLALRRRRDHRVARFLDDPDTSVVAEAARAIYDLNLNDAMPELARLVNETDRFIDSGGEFRGKLDTKALLRRAMGANFRLRDMKYLRNVGSFVTEKNAGTTLRNEAVELLKKWHDPKPIEPVLGRYEEFEDAGKDDIRTELKELLPAMLASSSGSLQSGVTELASTYDIELKNALFVRIVKDAERNPKTRAAALAYLVQNEYGELDKLVDEALQSDRQRLRIKARDVLARTNPERALNELRDAISNGTTRERQAALDTLSSMEVDGVDRLIADLLGQLLNDELPEEIQLDLLQAARDRSAQQVRSKLKQYEQQVSGAGPIAAYRPALYGGDPERGKRIFHNDTQARCVRCHTVNGTGGKAGPNLSDVGERKSREYILRSIIRPGADIADGFKMITVELNNGDTISGTLNEETPEELAIATPAGSVRRVDRDRVRERTETSGSSMPPMGGVLSKGQIRDLVSYLSSQGGEKSESGE